MGALKKKKVLNLFLSLFILAMGWAGMRYLAHFKAPPKKKEMQHPGPLVEVIKVKKGDYRAELLLTGVVQPKHELSVVPEVSGRVVWVNPEFQRGGYLKKGDIFFEIDSLAYKVERAKTFEALKAAKLNLEEVRSRARVAREEWQRLHPDGQRAESPLVLYGPQLEEAEARVEAAKMAYKKAVQDLERTRVLAPFDCIVEEERVEPGAFLRQGQEVARVLSTDAVEVKLPLALHDFLLLGADRGAIGTKVDIAPWGAKRNMAFSWRGTITQILPFVDEDDRMFQAVVTVRDPFQLNMKGTGRPGLRVNQFVLCSIRGKTIRGVFKVPERTLKDEGVVWRVGPENRLEIIEVKPVHRMRDWVLISGDIKDGDLLVASGISGASSGMKIRPVVVGERK